MFLQNYLFRSNSCFFWFLLISFLQQSKRFSILLHIKKSLGYNRVCSCDWICCRNFLYLVIFQLFPPRVWYVGIVMLLVTAINFLAAICMFHNMTPELKVERKLFSMDAVELKTVLIVVKKKLTKTKRNRSLTETSSSGETF